MNHYRQDLFFLALRFATLIGDNDNPILGI
jgi:hypothetical protein